MKKPLKVAAWSGIISLVVMLIAMPFMFLLGDSDGVVRYLFSFIITVVSMVLGILFLYGFVVLGKKFNVSLLQIMAWIGIVLAIIGLVFNLFGSIAGLAANVSAQKDFDFDKEKFENMSDEEAEEFAKTFIFIFIWVVISLFIGAYYVLFGIGLLKLKDKVPHAHTTGILDIIAGATMIIFIGFIVMMVSYIFKIVMLFEASRKFER